MTSRKALSRISTLTPIVDAHAATKKYVDDRGAIGVDADGEPMWMPGQVAAGQGITLGQRYAGRGMRRDALRPGTLSSIVVSDAAPAFSGQQQITYDQAQAAGFQYIRGGIMAGRSGLDVVKYNNANGTTEGTTFDLATRLSGNKIAAHLFFWEPTQVQIHVNNQRVSRWPVPSPGLNSQFVKLEMEERDEWDIDISLTRGGGFVQWLIPGDCSLMAVPPRDKYFWISDSYGTGAYGTTAYPQNNFLSVIPYWLAKYLGIDLYNMAQGGTGYMNDSGASGVAAGQGPYGGTKRREQLAKLPADLTAGIFFGSANDAQGQWSAADVKGAAKAAYAMVAADRPNLPLLVFGVEPGSYAAAGIDPVLMNAANGAIRDACAESPNVKKFIDMKGPDALGLLTGTGYQGAPANDGNQDFMVSNDKIHATIDGFHHMGLWCAEQLRKVVL